MRPVVPQAVLAETPVCRALTTAFALGLVLAGCSDPEPTLLDEDDFGDVVTAVHNSDDAVTRGQLWCSPLDPRVYYRTAPTSRLKLESGSVGATIVDQSDSSGSTADEFMDSFGDSAALCADGLGALDGDTIEPISGLGEDGVGWRTETGEGYQGEIAFIKLDDARLLVVGIETDQAELPIELDELIRLAREGAERVGVDD